MKDGELEIPARVIRDNFDPHDGDSVVDLYSSTMKGLRRKNKNKNSRREPDADENERGMSLSPPITDALIPENRNVQNDWLLEDMVQDGNLYKRKRDPMDDVVLKERSTRRRKDPAKNRNRNALQDDDETENMPLSDNHDSNDIFATDFSSERDDGRRTSNHFQELMDYDLIQNEELVSIDDEPRASTSRRMMNDNVGDENIFSRRTSDQSLSSRRRNNVIDVPSSSDDEDIFTTSKRNRTSSESSKKKSSLSRKRSFRAIQTTLPFKKVVK